VGHASARMCAMESRQADIEGKVTMVLATTTANTEVLQELKSMLCRYMGKEKDDGSAVVTKAAVENQEHVSCSATHPCRINTSQPDPHNSVEDSLGFTEAGHAVDIVGDRET
jgi:hypothetical protein